MFEWYIYPIVLVVGIVAGYLAAHLRHKRSDQGRGPYLANTTKSYTWQKMNSPVAYKGKPVLWDASKSQGMTRSVNDQVTHESAGWINIAVYCEHGFHKVWSSLPIVERILSHETGFIDFTQYNDRGGRYILLSVEETEKLFSVYAFTKNGATHEIEIDPSQL